MGTSVKMIDRNYGHLVAGADAHEREPLDGFDSRPGRDGRSAMRPDNRPQTTKAPREARLCVLRERRGSNPRPPA
jgi:hypothetical protein